MSIAKPRYDRRRPTMSDPPLRQQADCRSWQATATASPKHDCLYPTCNSERKQWFKRTSSAMKRGLLTTPYDIPAQHSLRRRRETA